MNSDILPSVTCRAYAKINLGIRILRKRADGYHDIETVFTRIQPCDEIVLKPSDAVTMVCDKPELPTDEKNLCIKAAELLRRHFSVREGAHITLKKQIPVGAGLGGGSSDAAAILLGLVQLWNLNASRETLSALALKLGSDIPYFLQNGTAYATGRGELLEYFDVVLPYWIVLVHPRIHISTAWAYQKIGKNMPATEKTTEFVSHSLKDFIITHLHHPEKLEKILINDFESVVMNAYPSVGLVKQELYDSGAVFALMSGSGSSVYGFFAEEESAVSAARQFEKRYAVFLTPPNFMPGKQL